MNTPLETYISKFDNYRSVNNPEKISLIDWLTSDEFADEVEEIRETEKKEVRDKLKAKLPAITPSGLFNKRGERYLIKHSGFIQFDIDAEHNPDINDFEKLRDELGGIKNIAYVGLSVSGNGVWGLIPIKYPDKHKAHFRALEKSFLNLGITIDPAPANVAALRGYSNDSQAIIRHDAKPFKSWVKTRLKRRRISSEKTKQEVENLIKQIHRNPIDVTEGYQSWLKIGFALAQEFGEEGRDYFHEVSKYNLDYEERETDQKYDSCLRGNGDGVTIGSFFYICSQYGITTSSPLNDFKNSKEKANGIHKM